MANFGEREQPKLKLKRLKVRTNKSKQKKLKKNKKNKFKKKEAKFRLKNHMNRNVYTLSQARPDMEEPSNNKLVNLATFCFFSPFFLFLPL